MKWFARKSLKALAWFLYWLPAPVRLSIGKLLGFLWFDVLRIRRDVAIDNLTKAFPQWTEKQRIQCARQSVHMMTLNLVEYALFPFFNRHDVDREFKVQGLENWEQARAQGKGVLLLSLHLGRGDLAVAALSRLGLPLHLISKEFKSPWLNDVWFGIRKKHGTQFISFHKSAFDVLRALRKNEGVIFVLDQFMGPPSGVPVTFFGHPTGTAKGLAMLAERSHAPVVPIYTRVLEDGRNEIVFGPELKWQEQGESERNIQVMTQIYTDKIEQIVQKYPEQWMWIHKRWKNFA